VQYLNVLSGTEQTVPVAQLVVHEKYGSPHVGFILYHFIIILIFSAQHLLSKAFENDIAVWLLASPLQVNEEKTTGTEPKSFYRRCLAIVFQIARSYKCNTKQIAVTN
jgi:hypothetical protein